jgi:hypothetical protein
MQSVDLDELLANPDELKSFFINMYNILMIHGSIEVGPPQTAAERNRYFGSVAYIIGGEKVWPRRTTMRSYFALFTHHLFSLVWLYLFNLFISCLVFSQRH